MYEEVNSDAADPADVGSRIDPVLARSWLLVNGAHADRFEAAERSRADIVVLDIEDAVAPKDKAAARDNVVRWLSKKNRYVLIHVLETSLGLLPGALFLTEPARVEPPL